MNTEVTPDNAARRYYMVRKAGSPEAWGNWFQPEADDVSHYIGNPTYEVLKLVPAATVTALEAEVAYYKENFQSCMTTLNAINDAITEADEDGRGFVPVNQLENILTGAGAK